MNSSQIEFLKWSFYFALLDSFYFALRCAMIIYIYICRQVNWPSALFWGSKVIKWREGTGRYPHTFQVFIYINIGSIKLRCYDCLVTRENQSHKLCCSLFVWIEDLIFFKIFKKIARLNDLYCYIKGNTCLYCFLLTYRKILIVLMFFFLFCFFLTCKKIFIVKMYIWKYSQCELFFFKHVKYATHDRSFFIYK